MPSSTTTRVVIAGAVGNIVEWYDFGLYGLMAPVLATLFFPSHDRIAALLGVYGGFAVGFAVRPLGAIALGRVGDRRGRQFVLVLSVVLMGAATVVVGALPSYREAGIWAPVLLICIRLFQGFSVGGEYVGSVTYLVEAAAVNRRGLAGSVSNVGATIGMLMAAGAAALEESYAHVAWAWRVPFFFGGALAFTGYLLRRHMPADGAEVFAGYVPSAAEAGSGFEASMARLKSGPFKAGAEAESESLAFKAAAEAESESLAFKAGAEGFADDMPSAAEAASGFEASMARLKSGPFKAGAEAESESLPFKAGAEAESESLAFKAAARVKSGESERRMCVEHEASHPSRKNRGAARVGHPDSSVLARWPALEAFRRAPRTMLFALLFCCGYGVSNYVIMVFLPTFAHEFIGVSSVAALKINTVGQALVLLIAPLAGWISDRWLRRRTMLALVFAAQAAVAWACFRWTAQAGIAGLWAAQLLLAGLLAAVMGTAPAMLAEQFERGYRVSAHALVLNVGVGIAGGTSPMVAVALIRETHTRMAPAWYLALACAVSAVAAMLLADRSREELDDGDKA